MKEYLVLADPAEDRRWGRAWHRVKAHSPPAAVESVLGRDAQPTTLVVEVGPETLTEVTSSVTFKEAGPS